MRNIPGWLSPILIFLAGCSSTSEVDDRFTAELYIGAEGDTLPYRIYIPDSYNPEACYPIILFLHGGSGAGTDNISQISGENRSGSHVWIKPGNREEHPAFVIAPQLPGLYRWDSQQSDTLSKYGALAVELIENLQHIYSIDIERVYLTGQSRGGWGVWDLIIKRPDLFAAAIPVCGGGNPMKADAIRNVPVWAFHGRLDKTVSVRRSKEMVEALKHVGGSIKYTEYRFSDHTIWNKVYGENDLVDWLFAQRKVLPDQPNR